MELMKASQWATRPNDERFPTLQALHDACTHYREISQTAVMPYNRLQVTSNGEGEPLLVGSTGRVARFTHWSFGQLCARVNAPASYLRRLPPNLVSDILTYELKTVGQEYAPNAIASQEQEAEAKLLLHTNGDMVVRAFTSPKYTRIWNADVTSRLIRLTDQSPEWQPAPAAMDGNRGLYASDHDMFAFLVDSDRRVFEKAPNGGLGRGFFVWNSEVGAATFGIMTFLYQYVCGNHIVWGATNVRELRIRHIGNADERAFREIQGYLRDYANASASEDEAVITRARMIELGKDKEAVLDRVFGLRVPALSRGRIESAYTLAEQHADWYGSPRSVWGMTSGITELAKGIPHTDDRVDLERAATKVLVAF